jgi:hypothetical protein
MPAIAQRFPTYKSFGTATLEDILGADKLRNALHYEAYEFGSCLFMNEGANGFRKVILPVEAQFSAVTSILSDDFDADGQTDLLLAGNFWGAEVETVRYDASVGLFLKGDGNGNFVAIQPALSGFVAPGNVKSMVRINENGINQVIIGNNNAKMEVFEVR